jgi:hypothetical protein
MVSLATEREEKTANECETMRSRVHVRDLSAERMLLRELAVSVCRTAQLSGGASVQRESTKNEAFASR